jgi:hypothetical protein
MAFQALQDGVKCVAVWGQTVTEWTNTFWFTKAGFTEAEQQALADAVAFNLANLCGTYLSINWNLKGLVCYDMNSITGPIKYGTGLPQAGTKAGQPASVNAALVVTLYTAQRGKSGRGRIYLTGFSEEAQGPTSIVDPVMITNIDTVLSGLDNAVTALGWDWVVASGQQNGIVLPAKVPYSVTSIVVRNDILGSQRRRIARP